MNFAKNKYGIAFLVIVAVAAIHYFFFYKPCEEPMDLTVAVKGLTCTLNILNKPVEELRAEFCSYIGKEPLCELDESDRERVLEMIDLQVLDCTKKALAAENFCTDKVEAKLKGR